ncbi:LOB domain-containing protein 41 [Cornus florida]|uniref:LOB domain-containing protein 41 n=1 Tax=Cornus florida TaxID=4283 RepID=UPI0028991508|nr:LOB domain-containing protein 41 [Cornus florida]
MRMSCNGCRVLRKGCSENCSIRPCLQWIKSPESQAHATVFLAKFYGRAGLMNLINSGPEHLRPAIFRSLLYEACGRIVNPIYGSVGLLWSGSWSLCQNAVEAVLRGEPITQIASDSAECNNGPPLKAYDIRHVPKDDSPAGSSELHRVRTRCRFKRSATKTKVNRVSGGSGDEMNCSTSHESSLSHQSEAAPNVGGGESRETESLGSAETAEANVLLGAEPESVPEPTDDGDVELELTLGFKSSSRGPKKTRPCVAQDSSDDGVCKMELGLDYPV